jgi:hypothetical protein
MSKPALGGFGPAIAKESRATKDLSLSHIAQLQLLDSTRVCLWGEARGKRMLTIKRRDIPRSQATESGIHSEVNHKRSHTFLIRRRYFFRSTTVLSMKQVKR